MSDIDKDFEKLVEQINVKIAEAAQCMKQANDLAQAAGYSQLNIDEYAYDFDVLSKEDLSKIEKINEWVSINPLFNEIDRAGWRTSSIGC